MARLRLTAHLGLALLGLLAGTLSGCHTSSAPGPKPETSVRDAQAQRPAQTTPKDPPSPAANPVPAASAEPQNAWPKNLPRLKPVIDKPFPEGATEAQVCEAINNTDEKDLWVRFGNLVPLYVFGSIFVLEAPGQTPPQIREFIRANHYGYDSRTQFCEQSKALVYVRSLGENHDNGGRIEGRVALAEQFQNSSKFKVLESYAIPSDQERLSDYCRADAELCEALVKLDPANEVEGLCARAISWARISDIPSAELIDTCRKLPREELACTRYALDSNAQDSCRAHLKKAFYGR